MPSPKRDRQRQNRIGGRAADLEAARQAKRKKSTRNFGIVALVVAVLVVVLAAMNSGGGDDDENTASAGDTTTTAGDTTTTAAGEALVFQEEKRLTDAELDKITCNDTKPAAPPKGTQYDEPGDGKIDPAKKYLLTMETSCGKIVLQLDPKAAPKTTSAIVFLTREGFYDGTKFHRVVDDFVIQGGDPEGTGTGGPGYDMAEEPPADGDYIRGDFAMAKTSAPNSTGSQFFIVTGDPGPLNSAGTYTYLGHVVEGFGVAQKMESFNQGDGPPTRELYLLKATITET